MSVTDHIAKLQTDAASNAAEVERLKKLEAEYPDLRRHVGRWGKEVYCSKSVNQSVTDYERRYNCSCCSDTPLEAWFYVDTPNGRVYSDPACFFVGEQNPYALGALPREGWQDLLRKENIAETMVERIESMFEYEKEKAKDSFDLLWATGATDDPEPLV